MAIITLTNCGMLVLFVQTIFVIVANAQFLRYNTETNQSGLASETSEWKHGDDAPRIMKAVIQENGKDIMKLTWTKTDQMVANKYLPVWCAQCGDIHESKENESAPILDSFIKYHDLEHSSAIVYVRGEEVIYGHVDTVYYIDALPVKHVEKKLILEVGGPYIRKNPNVNIRQTGSRSERSISNNHGNLNTISDTKKPITQMVQRGYEEKYYIESLLFVTHDIIKPIQKQYPDNYLFHILLKYAVYFNGIDMMLAKLPTPFRVYINLAGIIIEEDEDAFSPWIESTILDYNERSKNLELDGFDGIFSRYYLQNDDFMFKDHSFDHVFLSTGRQLEFDKDLTAGMSVIGDNLYSLKQSLATEMSGIPMSIVNSANNFYSYTRGAFEIAYVLGYQTVTEVDESLNGDKCYAYPQQDFSNCTNCLKWDKTTVNEIQKFMRENRNHCWLLNHPRSLYPNNVPRKYHSPARQCRCFGYHSHGEKPNVVQRHINEYGCAMPLQCLKLENRRYFNEQTILPFDGTPCDDLEEKVCWGKECVFQGPDLIKFGSKRENQPVQ